jgi:hypothetical protein
MFGGSGLKTMLYLLRRRDHALAQAATRQPATDPLVRELQGIDLRIVAPLHLGSRLTRSSGDHLVGTSDIGELHGFFLAVNHLEDAEDEAVAVLAASTQRLSVRLQILPQPRVRRSTITVRRMLPFNSIHSRSAMSCCAGL